MGEDPVFHAGEEDDGELQALRRVERHQGDDAVIVVGDLIGVGDERHPLEESGEAGLLRVALVLGGDRLQLGKVLDAGLVLGIMRGLELREVAGLLQGGLQHGRRARAGLHEGAQVREQLREGDDLRLRPGGQSRDVRGAVQRGPEGDALALSERLDRLLGSVSDPALGDIEDTAHRHVVIGIGDRAEVGDRIPDLAPLVEAHAPDDGVGQAHPDEDLLQGPGLGVGPVEDGYIRGSHACVIDERVDLICDEAGLIVLVVRDIGDDRRTRSGISPQALGPSAAVARDHTVGRIENGLRRPVVLLEEHRLGIGIVALELLDIANRRAAEGVDGLIGIADHAQLSRRHAVTAVADELADEDVLGVIGVLVLVDEDVTESAAVVLGHVREELEQRHGRPDEVVEVERIGAAQASLVLGVGLGEHAVLGSLRPTREGLLVDELVLQVRDPGRETARGVALGIEIEVLDHHGHEPLRVGRVVDREVRGDAEPGGLPAEDAHAGGVEGHHPHRAGGGPDQRGDPLLHLPCGLVGERDREDLGGLHALLADEMGDALGEHARLARACPCDDEQGTAAMGHGFLLGRVEVRHGAIVRRACDSDGASASRRPRERSRRHRPRRCGAGCPCCRAARR